MDLRFTFLLSLLLTSSTFINLLGCGRPSTPIEGPPSLAVSLSINQKPMIADPVISSTLESPLGAQALRLTLLSRVLGDQVKELGGTAVLDDLDDLADWESRLHREDRSEALLYALSSQILTLRSKDEASLRQVYQKKFPQGLRLIGRQVELTPPQMWTSDHYQRQLGYFRSWARLKLTQLQHQVIEGASFAELAKVHSHHQESAKQGGLISLQELEQLGVSTQVLRVARMQRVGELSIIVQDDLGAYLFHREDQERSITFDIEGVFWPHKELNELRFQSDDFWNLLSTLCQKRSHCELDQIMSIIDQNNKLREAWNNRAKKLPKSRIKKRSKRRTKFTRLTNKESEGDARKAPGGEQSWSNIESATFKTNGASYHASLSLEALRKLNKNYQALLTRAELFSVLPFLVTQDGVWLVRIKGRSELPAVSSPKIRMISLDLTQQGLQKKWGSWGVDQIGSHLNKAARENRLTEALKVLNLESTPIRTTHFSPQLLAQSLTISLDAGAQVLSETSESEGEVIWRLVELERREQTRFEEVREELVSQAIHETQDVKIIRTLLIQTWNTLKVELSLAQKEIDLSAANSVGFTRKIKL